MEMCEGTILGEVVAAGVATVESRRSSSDKFNYCAVFAFAVEEVQAFPYRDRLSTLEEQQDR